MKIHKRLCILLAIIECGRAPFFLLFRGILLNLLGVIEMKVATMFAQKYAVFSRCNWGCYCCNTSSINKLFEFSIHFIWSHKATIKKLACVPIISSIRRFYALFMPHTWKTTCREIYTHARLLTTR